MQQNVMPSRIVIVCVGTCAHARRPAQGVWKDPAWTGQAQQNHGTSVGTCVGV